MKIFIAGDISNWNIDNFSIKKISKKFINYIKEADICIFNLEGPIKTKKNDGDIEYRSNKLVNFFLKTAVRLSGKKQPQVFSNQKIIDLLKINKNTIVTLANNHIKDLGKRGFLETIKIINKNKIKFLGAGENIKEANKILRIKKIAIINTCWVATKKGFFSFIFI